MSKPRRVRWTCLICEVGALGPTRPRKNNAVRYCLACTAKTGRLTERVCLTLEKRRERKAEARCERRKAAAARKRERTVAKPRRTSRSWIRDDRYVVEGNGYSFNVMEVVERMCKSTKWGAAMDVACDYRKHSRITPRIVTSKANQLWKRTMKARGASGSYGAMRVQRRQSEYGGTTGHGGSGYGVTVTVAMRPDLGRLLMVLLHEIVHYVHLGLMDEERINGKRRPHGMDFNLIQARMAQAFWGYKFHPYEAGYSVGHGYAPSRHLAAWLRTQIRNRNPRVMKWIGWGEPERIAASAPME